MSCYSPLIDTKFIIHSRSLTSPVEVPASFPSFLSLFLNIETSPSSQYVHKERTKEGKNEKHLYSQVQDTFYSSTENWFRIHKNTQVTFVSMSILRPKLTLFKFRLVYLRFLYGHMHTHHIIESKFCVIIYRHRVY